MATLTQKKASVEEIKAKLEEAKVAIVMDYRGLTVEELTDLRTLFRKEAEATLTVTKNTLAKRAVEGTEFEPICEHLQGPTAIIFGTGDQVKPVKVARDYLKKNKKQNELRGGCLDGKSLSATEVQALADLPSREQLIAQLAGCIAAPLVGLARVLGTPGSQLARALDQVAEIKQKQGA
jgi:large subunit ribosomal protein L10